MYRVHALTRHSRYYFNHRHFRMFKYPPESRCFHVMKVERIHARADAGLLEGKLVQEVRDHRRKKFKSFSIY